MNYTSLKYPVAAILSGIFLCTVVSVRAQNDNPTGKAGIFNGNSNTAGSYDPYTANATRTIVDLVVPGAVGSYPLNWSRTMNSRRQEGPSYAFGSGGSWQHSHGWGIDWVAQDPRRIDDSIEFQLGGPARPVSYTVYYPDGRAVEFRQRVSAPFDPVYRGPAGVTDRFQSVVRNGPCYLLLSDGGKVQFYQTATLDTTTGIWDFVIMPVGVIDPHGLVTTLSYNGPTGQLSQITEPAGRWLKINYIAPFGAWVIGSVQAGYGSTTVTQSVTYSYQQFTTGTFNYTTLTGASYSDGTAATYAYQQANTNPNTGPPLIQTCDDVRYSGPMKKIAYEFIAHLSEDAGGIYGEFATARKWLYPAPFVVTYLLATHIEQRGDGPQRSFQYGSTPIDPRQIEAQRSVPQPYLLASYTDFKSNSTYLGYDPNTYLNYIEDANENITTFTRTPLTGKILTVTHPPDANGVVSTRQYFYTNQNTAYYLDHVTDELQHTTVYQRDGNQRIKAINYPDKASEEFTYNNFGQVLTHKMTSGGTEAFEYDFRGLLLRYRDPYHDPIGKTGKPTAWYQYDTLDRVSGVTGWRGTGPGDLNYTTNYDYNQRGQPIKLTHPIDPITGARYFAESTYNNDSTLATVTNERGNTAIYGYDDYKRLSTVTAPIAFVGDTTPRVTFLYYDRSGGTGADYRHASSSVGNVTTPLGNTVKTLYDNNFWKSSVTAGSGVEAATTTYTYDNVGNLKTVKDPAGQTSGFATQYFYDKRNRLTDMKDPIGSGPNSSGYTVSWTYDQIGNKKSQQRANDQLITYDVYDAMNRLQVQSVQHEANVSDRTVMTYDLAGNLETFTDARQKVYTYDHDLLNRRTSITYPKDEGGTVRSETYHYDLANNMDTYTNRGGAVQTFVYDNRNRQTSFTWSDGSHAHSTAYDPAGNLVSVQPGVTFEYDGRNRVTSDIQANTSLGLTRRVESTYDADGNRKTVKYPSGATYSFEYTSRNQLWRKSDANGAVVSYTYDLSGNRRTRTLRNGTSTTYTPDLLNRPLAINHDRAGASFGRFDYNYDSVNRVNSVKRDSARGDAYEYYLDDQLKNAQFEALNPNSAPVGAANTTSLVYDPNGNRVTQTNGTTPSYTYTANDLNQYDSVNGATPQYDAKGNLTYYNGWSSWYDAQNRLKGTNNVVQGYDFYYDGLNRQSLRYDNGAWVYSIWDGWDLIEEWNEASTLLRAYVHGGGTDEIVQSYGTGAQTIWYHQDAQGSTTHLTNDSGNVIEKYKYDPALGGTPSIYNATGQQIASSAFNNRFFYTGRYYLKEAGIYDYRNRFYHPGLGRFMQPDPIGFAGDPGNLYRYCAGDPVNWIDPYGLDRKKRNKDQAGGGGGAPDVEIGRQDLDSGGPDRDSNVGVSGDGDDGSTDMVTVSLGPRGGSGDRNVGNGQGSGSGSGFTSGAGSGSGRDGRGGRFAGGRGSSGTGRGTGTRSGGGSAPGWFAIPTSNIQGFNIDAGRLAQIGQGFDAQGLRQTAYAFERGATYYVVGWGAVAAAPGLWAAGSTAAPYAVAGWQGLYGAVETVTLTGIGAAYVGGQVVLANPQWVVAAQQFARGFTPAMGGTTASYYGAAGGLTRRFYEDSQGR